jgi:hypothetical protein
MASGGVGLNLSRLGRTGARLRKSSSSEKKSSSSEKKLVFEIIRNSKSVVVQIYSYQLYKYICTSLKWVIRNVQIVHLAEGKVFWANWFPFQVEKRNNLFSGWTPCCFKLVQIYLYHWYKYLYQWYKYVVQIYLYQLEVGGG